MGELIGVSDNDLNGRQLASRCQLHIVTLAIKVFLDA